MTPTPPDPSQVPTQRPIVAMLLAGIVAGTIGALGGATLNAPPPATNGQPDLLVRQITFRRPTLSLALIGERAYATSVKHLLDGGVRLRDEGEVPCGLASDAGQALVAELDGICAPGAFKWLHVIEMRFNPLDGGTYIEAYQTHLIADGGRVDDGRVPCDLGDAQGIANVAWLEALNCVEGVLDSP